MNGKKAADIEDKALWAPPDPLPPPMTFVLVTVQEDDERWVEPAWVVDGQWCDMYSEPLGLEVIGWCKFPEPLQ